MDEGRGCHGEAFLAPPERPVPTAEQELRRAMEAIPRLPATTRGADGTPGSSTTGGTPSGTGGAMQRQNAEARGQHDERLGQLCKVRASFPAAMEYGPEYLAVLRGDTVHSRGEEEEWSLVVRRRDHASGWVPTSYLAPMEQEPQRLEPAPVLEGTRTIRPGTTAHSLDHFLDIAEFNLWCRPKCLPMIAGEEVVVGLPIDPTGEWCFAQRAHNDEAGWVPRRFLEPRESRGGRRLA